MHSQCGQYTGKTRIIAISEKEKVLLNIILIIGSIIKIFYYKNESIAVLMRDSTDLGMVNKIQQFVANRP